MRHRQEDAEKLAGGPVVEVQYSFVWVLYFGSVDPRIIRAVKQPTAKFWFRDGECWFDDPTFGPVMGIMDLANSDKVILCKENN